MAARTIALVLAIALLTVAWRVGTVASPKLSATTSEVTASDVASVLGIQSWSYTLTFAKPVASVTVGLCELRPQADGSWQRTRLSGATGVAHGEADLDTLDVKVFSQRTPGGGDYSLRLGDTFSHLTLTTKPDLSNTYTLPGSTLFIDGCLGLAFEEKDPKAIHGREQDMVRVIALEIATE